MKKLLIVAVFGIVVGVFSRVFAAQVNPTSNVLGDTAATADTLVLRDSSGNMAIVAADISSNAITTPKINANAVTTAKLYLDLTTEKAACVTSARILGVCSTAPDSAGGCTCS